MPHNKKSKMLKMQSNKINWRQILFSVAQRIIIEYILNNKNHLLEWFSYFIELWKYLKLS